MADFLKSLLPHKQLETVDGLIGALAAKRDATDRVVGIAFESYVASSIALCTPTTVEVATKKVIDHIKTMQVAMTFDMLSININTNANRIAAACRRGCGNKVVVSNATSKLINSHLGTFMTIINNDLMNDNECIITYNNLAIETVDAGMVIVELPDGKVMPCVLPDWQNYFAYGVIS